MLLRLLVGCGQSRGASGGLAQCLLVNPQVVVGAAILDGGKVLAACRTAPPALAGKWELPGGKVEPKETDEAALVRECREELGVDVLLGSRVGRDWPIGATAVLRVWFATIARGELVSREHAELRWLTVEELRDVDWLAPDLPIVAKLAAMMVDLPAVATPRRPPGGIDGPVRRP